MIWNKINFNINDKIKDGKIMEVIKNDIMSEHLLDNLNLGTLFFYNDSYYIKTNRTGERDTIKCVNVKSGYIEEIDSYINVEVPNAKIVIE